MERMYAIGAVAYSKSVMMFEMACVYAMLMRTSCDQHFLSTIRVSHREASGRQSPKCCVAGKMKLKIVTKTTVPCDVG
jgi:hypothetical protein